MRLWSGLLLEIFSVCTQEGVSAGALRLGSGLLLAVLFAAYVVGRQRRYLEAGFSFPSGGPVCSVGLRSMNRNLAWEGLAGFKNGGRPGLPRLSQARRSLALPSRRARLSLARPGAAWRCQAAISLKTNE